MRYNSSATVSDTVQEFCRAWFEEREAERAAGFPAEDASLEQFNFEMLWRMRKQTPAAKP